MGVKPSMTILRDGALPGLDDKAATMVHLNNSSGDPSYLGPCAAIKLATLLQIPTLRTGHALVSVNGRSLGIYLCLDEPLSEDFQRHLFAGESGVLCGDPTVAGLAQWAARMPTNTTALDQVRKLCEVLIQTAIPNSFKRLDAVLDTRVLARYMAWEAVARIPAGYIYTDTNTTLAFGLNHDGFNFVAQPILQPFRDVIFPVFTHMSGELPDILLRTGKGRLQYLTVLDSLVNNTNIEHELLSLMARKANELRPIMAGSRASRLFEYRVAALEQLVRDRFASVRTELARLPARHPETLANLQLARIERPPATQPSSAQPPEPPMVLDDFPTRIIQTGTNRTLLPKLYHLSIAAPAGVLEGMSPDATNWVSVSVVVAGKSYTNVELRLKGSGTRQSFQHKPSFTLKFNASVPGQNLDGMPKVHLQNTIADSSYLHQYLEAWAFRRAGLAVPQVHFATVKVNGRDYGVFVLVEGVTKQCNRPAPPCGLRGAS